MTQWRRLRLRARLGQESLVGGLMRAVACWGCGSWPNPPCRTFSGWWVILPWRLGTVHESTDTLAVRRNSGPGHEKAADAGLGFLL